MKKLLGLAMLAGLFSASQADVYDVTFTLGEDFPSFHAYGDAGNVVIPVDMASILVGYSNFHVIGIGWDVDLQADDPSWLSELALAFETSDQATGVWLTPAVGDDFPGTGTYSSGGVVDLIPIPLDFYLLGDNILRLEWFEHFDDGSVDPDGFWLAGSEVTVRVDATAVPEPASLAILGLGALGLIRRKK